MATSKNLGRTLDHTPKSNKPKSLSSSMVKSIGILVDDLRGKLSAEGFYCLEYAGDLTILVRSKFASTLSERRQMALKIVENCYKDEKLSVNPN